MNVKIYIGRTELVPVTKTFKTVRYKLEFYANPLSPTRIAFEVKKNGLTLMNIDKTFSPSVSNLITTIRGVTADITALNLLSNLNSFNANDSIEYGISSSPNGYGNKDVYVDVTGLISDNFTIQVYSNTTSAINTYSPVQINTFEETVDEEYQNFYPIDLFKDENIAFTSKLSDIEKLSNVFTDFSNSFTVPSTPNNDDLFKHYYDVDIDNTFNANIRVNAYLEIDTFPLRYGKLQLESVIVKSHRPDSYKITFYGGLVQLSDLFGDDTINQLDYKEDELDNLVKTWDSLSRFDFEYNSTNFINSINLPTFKDGDVITPLIAYTDRDWNYGTNDTTDISINSGAILDSELRQALRVMRIIEAIETKYSVSFTRNFFGEATFNNLFLWLSGASEPLSPENELDLIDTLTDSGSWSGPDVYIDDFIQLNTTDNYITLNIPRIGTTIRDFDSCEFRVRPLLFNFTNPNIRFRVTARDYETNEIIAQSDIREGNDTTSNTSLTMNFKQRNTDYVKKIKFVVELSTSVTFDLRVIINMFITPSSSGPAYSDRIRQTTPNNQYIEALRQISVNMPNIKVLDFFQGIMKMFKLIIRPLTGNTFYVNTLDGYYSDGNLLDITDYVDNKQVDIERPLIYKSIVFKYSKTNNVLGEKFRENNDPINDEIGYGDLKSIYKSIDSKEELKIELPFENMLFERMTIQPPNADAGQDTNIVIGQSISISEDGTSFSPNNSKPIFFFNNGIADNTDYPFKIKFESTYGSFSYNYLIGNTNDELLNQVTDTINWGAEIDPWHGQVVANSLYLNYWSNWISTIYSLKQRKFTFESNLPPRYLEELSLNDRIIINDQRYKINDYTINLSTGDTKFTLFKDIYTDSYSPEPPFYIKELNGLVWSATEKDDNGSYFIKGDFTTFDGETVNGLIKLNEDGTKDVTFLTNLGGSNSIDDEPCTAYVTEDRGVLVTGRFTQYNGTSAGSLVKLHPNGVINTAFNIGSGLNNDTTFAIEDSNGKVIVGGAFTSINGTSRNRIVRLNADGSIDSSFNIGSGFNNNTLGIVENTDGSYYVSGFFTTYNGSTQRDIALIGATGARVASFDTGSGFTLAPNYRSILGGPGSTLYAFGEFSAYKGVTAGCIIRLTNTGDIDTSFNAGSGFNGTLYKMKDTDSSNVFCWGEYTSYDGISSTNGIIIDHSGNVIETFNSHNAYSLYSVGDDVYGIDQDTDEHIKLTKQNTLNLSRTLIQNNAGGKYFGFVLLSDGDWAISKIDTGDDTDWVDILTPSGTGNSEITIYCQEKASQTAPDVYETRSMYLKCVSGDIEKYVRIKQTGL